MVPESHFSSFPYQVLPLQSLHFSVLSDGTDDWDTGNNDDPWAQFFHIHTVAAPLHNTAEEHTELEKEDKFQDNEQVEHENKEIPKHNGLANKNGYSSHGMLLEVHSCSCCPKANIGDLSEVEPDSRTLGSGQLQFLDNSETHNLLDPSGRDMTACSYIQDPPPVIGIKASVQKLRRKEEKEISCKYSTTITKMQPWQNVI